MKFLKVIDDAQRVLLLRSWSGAELVKFMKSEAKVLFEETPAVGTNQAIPADTFDQVVKKTKDGLRKLVNKTMAMYQLHNTKQGERKWMDFIKDLEDKARILDFATTPYTIEMAIRDAAVYGMTDEMLKQKALAEEPDLPTLINLGQSREAGRESMHSLQSSSSSSVARIEKREKETLSLEELEDQIMRIKKQGKYSGKSATSQTSNQQKQSCNNCSSRHAEGRCPAKGKT